MKNVLFAVTVKQPIVFSKQPIFFPLAPLYIAAKFAYAWLNLFFFSNLSFGKIYIESTSKSDNKRLYSLVLLKALYHFLFLKCQHCLYCWTSVLSFWFLPCTTLLIVYLWEKIGGEVYAWFGCIDSFKIVHYVVAILHLKALEHFTFYGFSTNVVYAENQFACVLLSCCYACFVYASIMYCMTFQVHVLWWRIIKVMFMVQEHTPYSNSCQESKFMTYVK